MAERRNAGWWAWLAGALFVALLIGALALNRRTPDAPVEAKPAASPTPSASAPVLPKAELPLDRSALVLAANAAASAFAMGEPVPAEQAELVGKRFTLRLAIGCQGAVAKGTEAATGWRYDAADETLRVFATPQSLTEPDWLRPLLVSEDVDVAEIFWVERPWVLEGRCPAERASVNRSTPERPGVADEAEASDQARQLGVVQLLPAGSPRSAARGGRAYTAVVKRAPDAIGPDSWFALVLTGRLAAFAPGQAIACDGGSWTKPPRCLIAMRIERAAILDQNGAQLAEWQQ